MESSSRYKVEEVNVYEPGHNTSEENILGTAVKVVKEQADV